MSVATDIKNLRSGYPALAARVYPHRCSITRDTEADDGKGGWAETPSTIVSDLPCTFVPRGTNQREVIVAGQVIGMADGDIWLQALVDQSPVDIKAQDRVVIEALDGDPERAHEVIYAAPHQGILIQAAVRLTGA